MTSSVLVPMEPRRENNLKEAPASVADVVFEEHPMWVRVQDVLRERLQPFAEARAAVILGLSALFAVNSM